MFDLLMAGVALSLLYSVYHTNRALQTLAVWADRLHDLVDVHDRALDRSFRGSEELVELMRVLEKRVTAVEGQIAADDYDVFDDRQDTLVG